MLENWKIIYEFYSFNLIHSLPGKEALYEPGRTAGQMKMIRESHGVVAYTWIEEGDNSHWEKVGDVLGGANPDSDNKTTYEGKVILNFIIKLIDVTYWELVGVWFCFFCRCWRW